MARDYTIRRKRGETISFDVAVTRPDTNDVQQIVDLSTLVEAWCTVKLDPDGTDASALWQGTLGNGVVVTNAALGILRVTIPASVTASIAHQADYFFDVKIQEADDTETVVSFGRLVLETAITRAY